ncbi:hypothetical protein PC128_g23703 [Phytophthora cactorum]|nr:hypothetical protein PC128_g23703 [Phytophthora cactorum]
MDGDENGECSDNQGSRRLARQTRESGACVVAQVPTVTHDTAVINKLAANNASNVGVAPCQSTVNNEEVTDNQQTRKPGDHRVAGREGGGRLQPHQCCQPSECRQPEERRQPDGYCQ